MCVKKNRKNGWLARITFPGIRFPSARHRQLPGFGKFIRSFRGMIEAEKEMTSITTSFALYSVHWRHAVPQNLRFCET
jgi:hypothetical protein